MFNELSARIMTWAMQARDDEAGQGLVEYALIIALVSVVSVAALSALNVSIDGVFDRIGNTLEAAGL